MEAVYRFEQMKSQPTEVRRPLRKLTLSVPQRSDLTAGEKAAARGLAIAHGMELARDLGNLPGNVCTPTYLGERALAARDANFRTSRCRCSSARRSRRSAWARSCRSPTAATQPPRFIVLEY